MPPKSAKAAPSNFRWTDNTVLDTISGNREFLVNVVGQLMGLTVLGDSMHDDDTVFYLGPANVSFNPRRSPREISKLLPSR